MAVAGLGDGNRNVAMQTRRIRVPRLVGMVERGVARCRWRRVATRAIAPMALLALVSACAAAPAGRASGPAGGLYGPLGRQDVVSLLHRYDFADVRDLRLDGERWRAMVYRDGVWVPVEVLGNGTLLVVQYG